MTNIVRWLALNGYGSITQHPTRIWLSLGFIHFSLNRSLECDRIQFGLLDTA